MSTKGVGRMTPVVGSDDGTRYHKDFTLSITKALGDQLAAALGELDRAPLAEESIARLKEKPGVYQLYLNGEFVYVGKADKSLPARLRNHLRKISGRRNISLAEMAFSCLYVAEDFSALAPEQLLISHHKGMGDIPWNNNGFGNKDPGRQRDSTVLKENHFDVMFPIDLERPVEGLRAGETTLQELLETIKVGLPYNFRYGKSAEFKARRVHVPRAEMTADEVFQLVSAEIPAKWQVTALMGYVIMYDDSPTAYRSAWRYYRGGQPIRAVPEAEPPGNAEVDPPTLDD
ncbi:GIY-YIG nuclease family protein [Streptomyces millisiae]|uniref:Eco29kI family restriction endonuclease n=1 Tax=Streptomyces millisiae TaxID=3075542 RepID=A0ABU2LLN4_9ACTN|nr:Eco29kI family restriction endonuclease [Streptomyces sp. DSM 44918]MDT0317968.1 Eco29kI family restriction endonuclease [Streptomyces sp. DSM 44918]